MTLQLIAAFVSGELEQILFKIAIGCVIVWAIYALIQWMGWVIPRPVIIIFTTLICILLIYWAFQLFHALI